MSDGHIEDAIARYEHWYHRIEVAPGIVTPGTHDSPYALSCLDLPADLRGKRVLDIGTRDGFFAFECERRGAQVVAIDYVPADKTGFAIAAALLGSAVEHHEANVYDVSSERYGTFDLVLMLGLIYHLPDMMRALSIAHDVCRGELYLSTEVCDDRNPELSAYAAALFIATTAVTGKHTNYWAPTESCVVAMLTEYAFAVDRVTKPGPNRRFFTAHVEPNDVLDFYRRFGQGHAKYTDRPANLGPST